MFGRVAPYKSRVYHDWPQHRSEPGNAVACDRGAAQSMTDFAKLRRLMVESQIRTNKVTDAAVIDALESIPRERFVPDAYRSLAYIDEDLSIGGGRYLMEPMVFARLAQELAIRRSEVALVVGCGAGYGAAVLARLAGTVVCTESNAALATAAQARLAELEIDNAVVVEADLAGGYAKQAPYDVILFDGGVEHIPPTVIDQLAEGGRLIAVVMSDGVVGRATLVTRIGGSVSRKDVFNASVPVLPGLEAAREFAL